jgi:hypothetical protein
VSELSEEVEQLARESANGYEIIYRAE